MGDKNMNSRLAAFSCLFLLLSLTSVTRAAEIRALDVIHDGSARPPGFKLAALLQFAANEQSTGVTARVFRLTAEQPLTLG